MSERGSWAAGLRFLMVCMGACVAMQCQKAWNVGRRTARGLLWEGLRVTACRDWRDCNRPNRFSRTLVQLLLVLRKDEGARAGAGQGSRQMLCDSGIWRLIGLQRCLVTGNTCRQRGEARKRGPVSVHCSASPAAAARTAATLPLVAALAFSNRVCISANGACQGRRE